MHILYYMCMVHVIGMTIRLWYDYLYHIKVNMLFNVAMYLHSLHEQTAILMYDF